MKSVDDYRLFLNGHELVPIVVGGMGVDISTAQLAQEAARLGGIGHISDAMSLYVADKRFGTKFTKEKAFQNRASRLTLDKSQVKFNLEDLYRAQVMQVSKAMEGKTGPGLIFINVMEKLTMANPLETLRVRLRAALDGGIDGITLSAGLHNNSLKLIEDHRRFRDAKIGVVVSSARALKIFLRSAGRLGRLPDYVVVEGPLAGGHLGFGEDWKGYVLKEIVKEVLLELKLAELNIPVIPAGGIFTGSDAVEMLELGAGAVQVATRFTVTRECGLPYNVKQRYFEANEEDVVVSCVSPTGYPLRLLKSSPCFGSRVRPSCESFGYVLKDGQCAYIDAYRKTPVDENGRKLPVLDKVCLCHHFSKVQCYTCGHNVYRLKDTTRRNEVGEYELLSAEHVFKDYQFSVDHEIALPKEESELHRAGVASGIGRVVGVR